MYCLPSTDGTELLGAVAERCGVTPLGHVGREILELAVGAVEAEPALGHLDDVGRVAGLDHGQEFFEGLTPGQRDELDLDARMAVSNSAICFFRNSVRGGLVMTSTILIVESASADPADNARPMAAANNTPYFFIPVTPILGS
jgi:hypothetical protein